MASLAAFRAVRRAVPVFQKRSMGLGVRPPPPKWEGIDKVVRDVFPEDYQLAIAILGGYVGLIVLVKIKNALTKSPEPEEAKPAVVTTTTTTTTAGIPAIDSPEFEKFFESDALAKLLENEDDLNKLIESAK